MVLGKVMSWLCQLFSNQAISIKITYILTKSWYIINCYIQWNVCHVCQVHWYRHWWFKLMNLTCWAPGTWHGRISLMLIMMCNLLQADTTPTIVGEYGYAENATKWPPFCRRYVPVHMTVLIWFKFHRSWFARARLTDCQHWKVGTKSANNDDVIFWHVCGSTCLNGFIGIRSFISMMRSNGFSRLIS